MVLRPHLQAHTVNFDERCFPSAMLCIWQGAPERARLQQEFMEANTAYMEALRSQQAVIYSGGEFMELEPRIAEAADKRRYAMMAMFSHGREQGC